MSTSRLLTAHRTSGRLISLCTCIILSSFSLLLLVFIAWLDTPANFSCLVPETEAVLSDELNSLVIRRQNACRESGSPFGCPSCFLGGCSSKSGSSRLSSYACKAGGGRRRRLGFVCRRRWFYRFFCRCYERVVVSLTPIPSLERRVASVSALMLADAVDAEPAWSWSKDKFFRVFPFREEIDTHIFSERRYKLFYDYAKMP